MKIIAIKAGSPDHGDFVVETLRTAHEYKRVVYDDTALVTKNADGGLSVSHHRTHHFHRRGIDGDLLAKVGETIAPGEAVVLVLGEDAMMDAVAARVLDLQGGEMPVFDVGDGTLRPLLPADVHAYMLAGDDEGLLREAAVKIPQQQGLTERMPYS